MIARPRSVNGSGKLLWATTNTTLSPVTRLSCASSEIAFAGYGGECYSVAASAHGCDGNVSTQSSTGGFQYPGSYILILMHASPLLILRKSRMRRRARTDLSGGRPVKAVPTGTTEDRTDRWGSH